VIGLYDHLGLLRFSSGDLDACLAYAALFDMAEGSYTLEELSAVTGVASRAGTRFRQGAAIESIPADLAVVHGPIQQGHPIFGTRFGEDIAHVVVHGALADREDLGNLLVGEAPGHQLNNLGLPL